ncbi:hypothetical protein B0T20DRAFT_116510 [Sordaria brevicollis]|uniref:Uncharacterized protein n=1 Tax=Sordaria brevicollis TaxID=83679 RepID=A0AAE0UF50_SORBR|nr:hypothetical protein B0T20DRAFT_116510 [Sordaria brevicollis]
MQCVSHRSSYLARAAKCIQGCPIKRRWDGIKSEDIVCLCAAAYLLGRCYWFSRFGLELMCRHDKTFEGLGHACM